jgi:hypothetical protein
MKQLNRPSSEEDKILRWQYGAAALSFILFFPSGILSYSIFNGSIKGVFLPITIMQLFIGFSSIKNEVSILRPRGQREPARGKSAVVIGIMMIAALFIVLVVAFVLLPSTSWDF